MSHTHDLVDEEIEELAEELWTLGEEGRDGIDALRETTAVQPLDHALLEMVRRTP
jgi:hypothetical protein